MVDQIPTFEGPVCPLPLKNETTIVMGHGSGGLMTHNLIQEVFQAHFQNSFIKAGNDFANTPIPDTNPNGRLSISTDGHIISPIFFPGGDIGRLAICGTVNDISMSGSTPLYITASFILEEGLQITDLERIAFSMQKTAEEAGVEIVAGDTKVVEKGKGDGIFISTTGIGWLPNNVEIRGDLAQPGDVILVSGTIGDHGIAVLSARGDLGFETDLKSDVAPLNQLIQSLIETIPEIHVLRDPTRGGLATTLNEIARQSNVGLMIYDEMIPVNSTVQSACEMLGFDPLYVANEGKVVVILSKEYKEKALEIMRLNDHGKNAAFIGEVVPIHPGHVVLRTSFGTTRMLEMMSGEMLPRIC
ncbi:MAG: hydrogenase expression/formation protein HypE [Anaerolineaceae bacterium]|nr:hydrogenase expression/formation protein HypE [Anaerolineaceae bacterium]